MQVISQLVNAAFLSLINVKNLTIDFLTGRAAELAYMWRFEVIPPRRDMAAQKTRGILPTGTKRTQPYSTGPHHKLSITGSPGGNCYLPPPCPGHRTPPKPPPPTPPPPLYAMSLVNNAKVVKKGQHDWRDSQKSPRRDYSGIGNPVILA